MAQYQAIMSKQGFELTNDILANVTLDYSALRANLPVPTTEESLAEVTLMQTMIMLTMNKRLYDSFVLSYHNKMASVEHFC